MTETPKVYKLNKEKRASDNPGNLFILKSGKTQKKYCVQSGDNIYPEDGRFSIADSNVTYRSLLKAFAQANIKNPRN